MKKISKIVTNLPWEQKHKQLLENAVPEANIVYVSPKDNELLQKEMEDATVVIIVGRPDVSKAKKLEWMHWDAAGLDAIANKNYIEAGFAITGSAGRSSPALAEHVLYFMLNHVYHHTTVLAAQKAHQWGYPGQSDMKALFSQTIGIVGLGNTGLALAKRAKAFEMRVLAYDRSIRECDDVDVFFAEELGNSIDDMIPECDFIVMCCALTDKTYRMLGKKQFELMKPSAFIVNIGRGKTIDEATMLDALRAGRIAGAGLDTFEVEPLPQDSPVWDTPNLYVTPHFTPSCPDKLGRSLSIVLQNIERFQKGEPLINLLKPEDAYTKN
ncbi:MAG: D-2-hydroxyacid dehydrogenase [Christensenellales bacterium]|jgi:phosphoglycerate dehydrogenase-like enzyme